MLILKEGNIHMLTGAEARKLRLELGLSQKGVTAHTGISNTDISKFENGYLLLRSNQLQALRDFYLSKGADLPGEAIKSSEPLEGKAIETEEEVDEVEVVVEPGEPVNPLHMVRDAYHIDGIVIPPSFDVDEASAMMDEYQDNKDKIKSFLALPVPRGLFGDLDLDSVLLNVLLPMAENFAIIDRVHGDTAIAKWETIDHVKVDKDDKVQTYQDAVEHLFTAPLNRRVF